MSEEFEEPPIEEFEDTSDDPDEEIRRKALFERNRRRVLIPLVLLIALVVTLGLLGEPKKPQTADTPSPASGQP